MTPFEFVAWLGSTKAFTAMELLGTRVENGRPVNQSACVKGFDSIEQVFAARFCCTSLAVRRSFLLGTTAQAFVSWYIEDKSDNTQDLFPRRSILHGKAARDDFQAKSQLTRRIVSQFPADEVDGVVAAFKTYFNLSAPDIAMHGSPIHSVAIQPHLNRRTITRTCDWSILPSLGHRFLLRATADSWHHAISVVASMRYQPGPEQRQCEKSPYPAQLESFPNFIGQFRKEVHAHVGLYLTDKRI